jgi:hypothetical protein
MNSSDHAALRAEPDHAAVGSARPWRRHCAELPMSGRRPDDDLVRVEGHVGDQPPGEADNGKDHQKGVSCTRTRLCCEDPPAEDQSSNHDDCDQKQRDHGRTLATESESRGSADGRAQRWVKNGGVGRFVITVPTVSIARELWRFGEAELAARAAHLTSSDTADIGERAGVIHQSGEATRLWPDGPSGVSAALMLATIEHLEGLARPCSRARRLPEKNLPPELQVSEADRWTAIEPVSREVDRRLHGNDQ